MGSFMTSLMTQMICSYVLVSTSSHPVSNKPFENGNSCEIHENSTIVYVDCSHRGLTRIPTDLPLIATHIDLSYNIIQDIGSPFIGYKHSNLTTIDLSYNKISHIQGSNFVGVENLKRLFLNNNQLNTSMYSTSVSINCFYNLTKLEELKIDHNLWNSSKIYRDDLVTTLSLLKYISLDGLPDVNFEEASDFSYLINLQRLDLYGGINKLTDDTLKGFANSSILTLKVLGGKLTDISAGAFLPIRSLLSLDISGNIDLGLNNNISRIWQSLTVTNITELILKHITEPTTNLVELKDDFFNFLDKTKLEKLNFDDNRIAIVPNDLCIHLPHITHISTRYNHLTVDTLSNLAYNLPRCRNLTHIDINYQTISKDEYTQRNRYDTETTCYGEPFETSASCMQNRVDPPPFTNPKYFFSPPNLRTLLMADTRVITDVSPRIVFLGKSNLSRVDLSSNRIASFAGQIDFQYMSSNRMTIDLSNNLCTHLDAKFVNSPVFRQVKTLILHDNQLGAQIEENKQQIFGSMTNLQHLDLANNLIRNMPKDMFNGTPQLQFLNLSGNALRFVTIDFTQLSIIKHIDLSRNILDSLNSTVRLHIESKNITVNLSDNPFTCTCNTLSFLEWAHEQDYLLNNFESYVCPFKESNIYFGKNLKNLVIPKLKMECSWKAIVKDVASSAAAVVVVITISVFIHRHRWDIRFFFLDLMKNRIKERQSNAESLPYEYDALVSFSNEDRKWVSRVLVPYLERGAIEKYLISGQHSSTKETTTTPNHKQERALKLCVHHRDFEAGPDIQCNIKDYISNSRKVIVVLSPHFCNIEGKDKNWCEYELRLAHWESCNRGYNVIFPLYLRHIRPGDATTVVAELISKQTYMKVPTRIADLLIFEYDEKKFIDDRNKRTTKARRPSDESDVTIESQTPNHNGIHFGGVITTHGQIGEDNVSEFEQIGVENGSKIETGTNKNVNECGIRDRHDNCSDNSVKSPEQNNTDCMNDIPNHSQKGGASKSDNVNTDSERIQELLADESILPIIGSHNINFWSKVRSQIKTLELRTPKCQCGKTWQGGIDQNVDT